jgi:hypothetical protein
VALARVVTLGIKISFLYILASFKEKMVQKMAGKGGELIAPK